MMGRVFDVAFVPLELHRVVTVAQKLELCYSNDAMGPDAGSAMESRPYDRWCVDMDHMKRGLRLQAPFRARC